MNTSLILFFFKVKYVIFKINVYIALLLVASPPF